MEADSDRARVVDEFIDIKARLVALGLPSDVVTAALRPLWRGLEEQRKWRDR